jgi:hypothetical protein
MTDSRLVDFPGKRRLWKQSFIDISGRVAVRIDFRNGQTRTLKLRPDMIMKFAAFGAERKLCDEIRGVANIDEAVKAVDELITRLEQGKWGKRSTDQD